MSAPVYSDEFQDIQDRIDAYELKDYKTALGKLKPLAEKGHSKVQFTLGAMYGNGRGVRQDKKEAVKWFNLSAEQRSFEAHFILGMPFAEGQGVLQNYVQAHKWFNLSADGIKEGGEWREEHGKR